ncbi:MAG TPA: FAD-binding oxidoreductase [Thermoleophilaceae bacterium]|jgi:FAD/FMN-containing dehydrogenase
MSSGGASSGHVFPGARVGEDDPRYSTLVRGFNLRWVGRPRYVEVCGDTDQVVRAVQRALDDGLRITARGGGHCYEDFVSGNDGGVILDLSPMNGVYLDEATGCHCIEGGATLWNAYVALYKDYDVTIPGGSCASVGAGGHVTGGGYGLLSRLHGLTIDFLEAVEIVVVDDSGTARAITVSRDSQDADERLLLWASRGGGGGNFGIVTRFLFRDLPPAPSRAYILSHAWDWSALDQATFARLIANYGEFLKANSAVGSPYSGLFSMLHLNQRAGECPQIVLAAQYVGDEPALLDEFESAIEAGLPSPTGQVAPAGYLGVIARNPDVRELPWLYATQTMNGTGANRRGKYKSAYMIEPFPDYQVQVMWTFLSEPTSPNPAALLQVDSYGCQVNALEPDATAIPQRSSIMKLQYQTYWTDPAQDDENLSWIRDFYVAMYGPRGPVPDGTVDGCYVNYPDVDLPDWQHLYYKGNYPELQRAKGRWDPGNVFNHRQSVEPPG